MGVYDQTDISADEAEAALAEHRRREAQTIAEGTSPWPASAVIPWVLALPPLGYLIDIDLVWLFAALIGVLAAFTVTRRVKIRADRRSARADLQVLATLVVALGADVAVQYAVRGAGLALPNMWGMAAVSVVVLALVWPVQRRTSRRSDA